MYQYYGRGNSQFKESVHLPPLTEFEFSVLTRDFKYSKEGRRRLRLMGMDVESDVDEEETVGSRGIADNVESAVAEEKTLPLRRGADTPMSNDVE
jgi:hypothetical protein